MRSICALAASMYGMPIDVWVDDVSFYRDE
jgi:hypothetical protein